MDNCQHETVPTIPNSPRLLKLASEAGSQQADKVSLRCPVCILLWPPQQFLHPPPPPPPLKTRRFPCVCVCVCVTLTGWRRRACGVGGGGLEKTLGRKKQENNGKTLPSANQTSPAEYQAFLRPRQRPLGNYTTRHNRLRKRQGRGTYMMQRGSFLIVSHTAPALRRVVICRGGRIVANRGGSHNCPGWRRVLFRLATNTLRT